MKSASTEVDLHALPLPIAALLRRSYNAKSALERHLTAWHAWEASVRLGVCAQEGVPWSRLVLASFGTWAGALRARIPPQRDPRLLALFEHLHAGIGAAVPAGPSLEWNELLQALASYRNTVIGHGAVRSGEFYERGAAHLRNALPVAWEAGCFWPREARLVFVEEVITGPDGSARARVLRLHGEASRLADPDGTPLAQPSIRPGRVYLRTERQWSVLHPLVLYQEKEFRERVWLFNGIGRQAQFLDFVSGVALKGEALADLGETLEEEVRAHVGAAAREALEEPPPSRTEDRLGDFVLERRIGAGGMGEVYRARQEPLGRLVALKILPEAMAQDGVAVARFRREIAALGRCEHPHVVKIHASGRADRRWYYAMELVDGGDLARVAREISSTPDFEVALDRAAEPEASAAESSAPASPRAGAPPRGEAIRALAGLFRDAARGIQHLHDQGIVHRDIKPGNLMVTRGDHRVVVMDLGLAKLDDPTTALTQDHSGVLGTLRYLAPEQLQRKLLSTDHRVDVYALGATFYELLCGRPLFEGEGEELVGQILRDQPVAPSRANPALPRDLDTILRKATEKDARLRYGTAAALADDLEAFLAGRPIAARPPSFGYYLRLAVRRNPALAASVALSVAVIATGTAIFLKELYAAWRSAERDRLDAQILATSTFAQSWPAMRDGLMPLLPERMSALDELIERVRQMAPAAEATGQRIAELQGSTAWNDQVALRAARELEGAPRAATLEELRAMKARIHEIEELSVSGAKAHAAWERCASDLRAHPEIYGNLGERLRPIFGLVPLEKNPHSSLWEFWHVASGERPEPIADVSTPTTKRWQMREETGVVLVLIPRQASTIGEDFDPSRQDFAIPMTEVNTEPFLLSKYEMTQGQWTRLRFGENPSMYQSSKGFDLRHPVESLDAREALRTLSMADLRLPSHAEWELAARAGSTHSWHTGNAETSLERFANLLDVSYAETYPGALSQGVPGLTPVRFDDGFPLLAPVGSYEANAFGLHDVHGNVYEWCGILVSGQQGDLGVRGGSYEQPAALARFAHVFWAQFADHTFGVRPARDLVR